MRSILLVILAIVLPAACTSAPTGPYGSVAEPGTAVYAIKRHYERQGREQNGMCTQMILEDVIGLEPLDEASEDTVLRVRYAYSSRSGNTNRRFGCNGFATRDFTLAENDGDWQVLEMSDPLG